MPSLKEKLLKAFTRVVPTGTTFSASEANYMKDACDDPYLVGIANSIARLSDKNAGSPNTPSA
jgi:hypothetical protein